MRHGLFLFALDLRAEDARVRLCVVLEDRLSLLKIHSHEAVRVVKGHLSCKGIQRPILNQVLHLWRHVLQCLQVLDLLRLHGRHDGSIVTVLQSVQFVKHTRVSLPCLAPDIARIATIIGCRLTLLEHD